MIERGTRSWRLTAKEARIAADVQGSVDAAMERGRDGSFLTRAWREATGGTVAADVQPKLTYNDKAVVRLLDRVRRTVDKPAKDASVTFTGSSVAPVPSSNGRRLKAARTPPRDPRGHRPAGRRPHLRRAHQAGEAEGHDGRARPQVPDAHHREPRWLQAHALQEPEAREDLSDRGRRDRPGDARGPLRDPGQAGQPDLERARQRVGGGPRRQVDPAGARQPAQGALDGHLRRRRASTGRATSGRSAPPHRTAACAWPSPTSSTCSTGSPSGRRSTSPRARRSGRRSRGCCGRGRTRSGGPRRPPSRRAARPGRPGTRRPGRGS